MSVDDERIIRFECTCGAELQATAGEGGGQVECPSCHKTVQVPCPADSLAAAMPIRPGDCLADLASAVTETMQSPPRRSRPLDRSRALGPEGKLPIVELICGCLMIATFLVPWVVHVSRSGKRTIVMSWNILAHAPKSLVSLLVGIWAIGLATILVAIYIRGKLGAIAHCLLGLLTPVLYWACFAAILDLDMPFEVGSSLLIKAVIAQAAILLQIIATNVRLKVGPSVVIRMLQVIASVSLIILIAINFAESQALLDGSRARTSTEMVTIVVGQSISVMVFVGMGLILIHAAGMIRNDKFCRIALYLVYTALAASVVFLSLLLGPGIHKFTDALPLLNAAMLFYPPLVLICIGAIKAISWHMGQNKT